MFILNWVDICIFTLFGSVLFVTYRAGFVKQLILLFSLVSSFLIGSMLFYRLLPISDRNLLVFINTNLVLCFAIYVAFRSIDVSEYLIKKITKTLHKNINSYLGSVTSIPASIAFVYFLAVTIINLPFVGLSNSFNDSYVVHGLIDNISNNRYVFKNHRPNISFSNQTTLLSNPSNVIKFKYDTKDFVSAAEIGNDSTVQITGFGCGGIISGSGFAIDNDLIVTNAHIIAGVKRPVVKNFGTSFETTPVYFDSILDLAILRIEPNGRKFIVKPLIFTQESITPGETVAMLGYPNDKYTISPGVVIDGSKYMSMQDTNISNKIEKYIVHAHTDFGNSGGPIVLPNGEIAGMVYAKIGKDNDYAYVLSSKQIVDAIKNIDASKDSAYTGLCL